VSAGSDGQVENSYLEKRDLERSAKDKYPLTLIKLMTRYAEDLVWANNVTRAQEMYTFIVTLTEGRVDASDFRKGKSFRRNYSDPEKGINRTTTSQ